MGKEGVCCISVNAWIRLERFGGTIMHEEYTFWSAVTLLVLILDPFGNVAVVATLLKDTPVRRRLFVICRECFIAFAVLLLFCFSGDHFLNLMHLDQLTLQIAGGVVLFLIGLDMIFPKHAEPLYHAGEPFIVPLAIPLIAGPSAMIMVLLFKASEPQRLFLWSSVLFVSVMIVTIVLSMAQTLYRLLGEKVMQAVAHLMGLVVVAMSIKMFLQGVRAFILSF